MAGFLSRDVFAVTDPDGGFRGLVRLSQPEVDHYRGEGWTLAAFDTPLRTQERVVR